MDIKQDSEGALGQLNVYVIFVPKPLIPG